MKIKIYLCIVVSFYSLTIWATNDNNSIGGRVAGMGYTGVTLSDGRTYIFHIRPDREGRVRCN